MAATVGFLIVASLVPDIVKSDQSLALQNQRSGMLSNSKVDSADSLIRIVLFPLLWFGGFGLAACIAFKVFLGLVTLVVQDRVPDERVGVSRDSRIEAEGVRLPPTIAAADAAQVEDQAAVVGIEAFGKHRAYLLGGMTSVSRHAANDLVNGVPISITYCPITGCVATYINPDAHQPLDIAIAGFAGEGMAIHSGGYTYSQEGDRVPFSSAPTDHIPYAHYPFVQTTWKKWREAHPDTDIYVGG
jgi:hypothetical protein